MVSQKLIDKVLAEQAAKGRRPCPLCGRLVGLDKEGRVHIHGGLGGGCPAGGRRPPEGKTGD